MPYALVDGLMLVFQPPAKWSEASYEKPMWVVKDKR